MITEDAMKQIKLFAEKEAMHDGNDVYVKLKKSGSDKHLHAVVSKESEGFLGRIRADFNMDTVGAEYNPKKPVESVKQLIQNALSLFNKKENEKNLKKAKLQIISEQT